MWWYWRKNKHKILNRLAGTQNSIKILLLSAALGCSMAGKSIAIQPPDAAASTRKFYQIQFP
jgi:hypothetical protein